MNEVVCRYNNNETNINADNFDMLDEAEKNNLFCIGCGQRAHFVSGYLRSGIIPVRAHFSLRQHLNNCQLEARRVEVEAIVRNGERIILNMENVDNNVNEAEFVTEFNEAHKEININRDTQALENIRNERNHRFTLERLLSYIINEPSIFGDNNQIIEYAGVDRLASEFLVNMVVVNPSECVGRFCAYYGVISSYVVRENGDLYLNCLNSNNRRFGIKIESSRFMNFIEMYPIATLSRRLFLVMGWMNNRDAGYWIRTDNNRYIALR